MSTIQNQGDDAPASSHDPLLLENKTVVQRLCQCFEFYNQEVDDKVDLERVIGV